MPARIRVFEPAEDEGDADGFVVGVIVVLVVLEVAKEIPGCPLDRDRSVRVPHMDPAPRLTRVADHERRITLPGSRPRAGQRSLNPPHHEIPVMECPDPGLLWRRAFLFIQCHRNSPPLPWTARPGLRRLRAGADAVAVFGVVHACGASGRSRSGRQAGAGMCQVTPGGLGAGGTAGRGWHWCLR